MRNSLAYRLWYDWLQFIARLGAVALFQIRCHGREHVPMTGAGLMLANHQSNLDPILIGLVCERRLNYVARKTLFSIAPLRWLLESLDTISIDRDGSGFGGLKETLKRLKRGDVVLIFAEGTRSPDGEVQPLKPGFCAIARRSAVPLIPAAMDGAFDAWPRHARFPKRSVIHVAFGPPLQPNEVAQMNDAQLMAEMERRIRACHAQCRQGRLQASPPTAMAGLVG